MFRFTIRDLLWLTVVVALSVGWAIEFYRSPSRRLEHRVEALEYALTQEGFTVEQPSAFEVVVKKPEKLYESIQWTGPGPGSSHD